MRWALSVASHGQHLTAKKPVSRSLSRWKMFVTPLGHSDPSGSPTALLSMRQINPTLGGETIHVDLTIDQLERILHRHSVDPSRRFRTHLSPSDKEKVKKT